MSSTPSNQIGSTTGRRGVLVGIGASAALAASATALAPAAAAAGGQGAVVKTQTYLRKSASWSGAQVTLLPVGTVVYATGATAAGWHPVKAGSQTGWIHSTMTSALVSPPATLAIKATALRSGTSSSASKLATIPLGAKLARTGRSYGSLSQVTYAGKTGWAASAHLVDLVSQSGTSSGPTGTRTVTVFTYLRTQPSLSGSGVIGLLAGSTVTLTGRVSGGWSQATQDGKTGWVVTEYLSSQASSGSTGSTGAGTINEFTYLRAIPSWEGQALVGLPVGTAVTMTGKVSGSWSQVSTMGSTGWVSTAFITKGAAAPVGVRPVTKYKIPFTAAGRTSWYSVYANNIDWSKPVGVAWYFDGDYSYETSNRVENPTGVWMTGIAAEANRRNMVLVAPRTPSYDRGYTWWGQQKVNQDWFIPLAQKIFKDHVMLLKNRQWLIGYSGGSEFISETLMARRQLEWLKAGTIGTTIVGGGTAPTSIDSTSPTFRASFMNWHVADDDDYTAAASGWSAEAAAIGGERMYRVVGSYTRTRLFVTPALGYGHYGYDFPALMSADMDRAGIKRLR